MLLIYKVGKYEDILVRFCTTEDLTNILDFVNNSQCFLIDIYAFTKGVGHY